MTILRKACTEAEVTFKDMDLAYCFVCYVCIFDKLLIVFEYKTCTTHQVYLVFFFCYFRNVRGKISVTVDTSKTGPVLVVVFRYHTTMLIF